MLVSRLAAVAVALALAVTFVANLTPIRRSETVILSEIEELPYASMETEEGTLRVLLPANPSTGFEWTYEIGDPTVLECTESGFLPPADPMPGASGHYSAAFRALLPNAETTLSLEYARSWEGEAVETLYLLISTDEDGFLSAVITESTLFAPDVPLEDEGLPTLEISGSLLTVRLEGNPSTGYEWTSEIGDETVLKPLDVSFLPAETEEPADGAGGLYEFRFEGIAPDSATALAFLYARSWEDEPIDRLDLIIFTDAEGNLDVMEAE